MMLIYVVPIVALLLAAAYRLTCVLRGRRVVASVPMLVLWLAGIHFVIGIPVPWAAPAFLAGAIAKRPLLIVVVPVLDGADVRYLLSLTISLDRLHYILSPERLPPDWLAGMVDRDGIIIGRSQRAEELGYCIPPFPAPGHSHFPRSRNAHR